MPWWHSHNIVFTSGAIWVAILHHRSHARRQQPGQSMKLSIRELKCLAAKDQFETLRDGAVREQLLEETGSRTTWESTHRRKHLLLDIVLATTYEESMKAVKEFPQPSDLKKVDTYWQQERKNKGDGKTCGWPLQSGTQQGLWNHRSRWTIQKRGNKMPSMCDDVLGKEEDDRLKKAGMSYVSGS